MKRIFLFLLLANSCCFAQFSLNYSDIQNKYAEYSTIKKDSISEQIEVFENSLKISFKFSKPELKLISITFQKSIGISQKEINAFEEKYLDNFRPTRKKNTEGISVYYDELHELMKFKVFQNANSNIVNLVAYTINRHDINPFIILMDKDHVKSKLKKNPTD